MEEIWKDIKGYEGLYQISNLGRIKSLPRTNKNRKVKKETMKVFTKLPKGYLKVGLNKEGKTKYCFVHRLVAEHFIPNLENKPCVNHKDCNTSNNCVENLEWVTHKENNSYKNHHLKRNIASVIYYLKRDYFDEKNIIELAEKKKKKIANL